MGSVFRKCVTRPIPVTATVVEQLGERVARWKTKKAKWMTAEAVARSDGRDVIRVESGTYYAQYRDAGGIVRVVPIGCRTEDAARQALFRLERDTERVRMGVATHAELTTAVAAALPIMSTVDACIATFTGSKMHRENTRDYLTRLVGALAWQRPVDMRREDLERWFADETRWKRSARSRNAYQSSATAFANWYVRSSWLTTNPFTGLSKADTDADRRRQRRALTPDELQRLMHAAQTAVERPALKQPTNGVTKGARPAQRLSGDERAQIYAILAGTGLRVGELAQLRVADMRLDARTPHVDLSARITKNGEDDTIPLRADLVALLRRRREGRDPASLLYDIPADFIKRFNADCRRAGIPKRDERGRTVDIHALRTTFGTWLASSGVAPRVAQSLMRHSDIRLTMSVYTDPKLLDTAAAVESIPSVAPSVAVTLSNPGATEASAGKSKRP